MENISAQTPAQATPPMPPSPVFLTEKALQMIKDTIERENLAGQPRYRETIAELSRWLPAKDVGPAPGSASRVLTLYDKTPVWEGQPIKADDPIPE